MKYLSWLSTVSKVLRNVIIGVILSSNNLPTKGFIHLNQQTHKIHEKQNKNAIIPITGFFWFFFVFILKPSSSLGL